MKRCSLRNCDVNSEYSESHCEDRALLYATRRSVVFIAIIQINTLAGRTRENVERVSDLPRKTDGKRGERNTLRAIGACSLACFGIPITLRATSDSERQRVALRFETAFATGGGATMLVLRDCREIDAAN